MQRRRQAVGGVCEEMSDTSHTFWRFSLALLRIGGGVMAQYWVVVQRTVGEAPEAIADAAMARDIDALNDEMDAAGIRIFVGGLRPVGEGRTLRRLTDGTVSLDGGSSMPGDVYIDGFWVLDVRSFDEALAWGQKAAVACRASIEVRPFY